MAVQVATERNAEGNSYVLKNGEWKKKEKDKC